MKYYNVEGYVRHKHDLERTLKNMKHEINYDEYGNVDYTQMFNSSIIKGYWMEVPVGGICVSWDIFIGSMDHVCYLLINSVKGGPLSQGTGCYNFWSSLSP